MIVSSGPGQEREEQVGRKVRYLDAVRKGKSLSSTFVAIHEPAETPHSGPIEKVERTDGVQAAGNEALALKIHTRWGNYHILNHFDHEFEAQGVVFKGKLAVLGNTPDDNCWALASEAETLKWNSPGFCNQPAEWSSPVDAYTADRVTMKTPKPERWAKILDGCQNYAIISDGKHQTGYPIRSIENNRINLARFPLVSATRCTVPSFFYGTKV